VQTFLPYPDLAQSADALDSPRLGKQRVEALQILRALTFPSYGWHNHPVTLMWRGYVPALTRYGLAMVDEWMARGAGDSTRTQIAEFAPGAVTTPASELPMPSWLGNAALHRSHQSNLIRKDPAFYEPLFPGIPGDLDYVWPGPDEHPPDSQPVIGSPLMILRPRDDAQLESWIEHGELGLGESSPVGSSGPKWKAQLALFRSLPHGTTVGLLAPDGQRITVGELSGERFTASETVIRRSAFPYPALLQDPRTLFETIGPTVQG
jgi:Pyrimidine dimer DNA glycosylase